MSDQEALQDLKLAIAKLLQFPTKKEGHEVSDLEAVKALTIAITDLLAEMKRDDAWYHSQVRTGEAIKRAVEAKHVGLAALNAAGISIGEQS